MVGDGLMTPQAIRAPELPAGSVISSSGSAWITTAVPPIRIVNATSHGMRPMTASRFPGFSRILMISVFRPVLAPDIFVDRREGGLPPGPDDYFEGGATGAAGIPAGGADGAPGIAGEPGIAGTPPGVFKGPGIVETGAPPFMRLLEDPPLPEK